MSESTGLGGGPDPAQAVRATPAEALGTNDLDIVANTTDRLPDGTEICQVTAAVRGQPNQVTRGELDAAAGRPLSVSDLRLPVGRIDSERARVVIDPPSNMLTLPTVLRSGRS